MLFTRDFLMEEAEDASVSLNTLSKRRWSTDYRRVFEHEGKFYETFYSTGNTEQQEEYPYDDAPDDIECDEVFPEEVTITVYRKKKI